MIDEKKLMSVLDSGVHAADDPKHLLQGPAKYVPTPPEKEQLQHAVPTGDGLKRYHQSELKSAIQKYVRRLMPGKAMAAARAMWPKDAEGLMRRSVVIAAEDAGWRSIAPAFYAWREAERLIKEGQEDVARELMVTSIGELAKRPKDRDTAAIWSAAKWCRKDPVPVLGDDWQKKLIDALVDRDELLAVKIAIQKAGKKETKAAFWQALRCVGAMRSIEALRCVEACKARLNTGTRDADIGTMVAAAILGCCRSGNCENEMPPTGVTAEERTEHHDRLDWWTQDLHGFIGQRAVAKVVEEGKAEGLDAKALGNVQFYLESLFPEGAQKAKYYDEAADWELKNYWHVGDMKFCQEKWKKLRPIVQAAIEKAMAMAGKA